MVYTEGDSPKVFTEIWFQINNFDMAKGPSLNSTQGHGQVTWACIVTIDYIRMI